MRTLGKVLLVVLLMFTSVVVYADGMLLPRLKPRVQATPQDIYQPEQKAFIYYQNGLEDLILEVAYEGKVSEFAWVVPVPQRPKLKMVKGAPFHELSRLTQPPRPKIAPMPGMKGIPGKAPSVTLLERKQVGIYDVSVLTATVPAALIDWLNKNKYWFPKEGQPLVEDYIKRKWIFVAMRITTPTEAIQKGLNQGVIQPLRLTFKSKHIVYPMKITSLNGSETEILLYVAAPYRVEGKGFTETFRKKVTPKELLEGNYPTLRKLIRSKCVLTKLRAVFAPEEITKDLVLSRSWLLW